MASFTTMKATTTSPETWSGAPTTATSPMLGYLARALSTSTALMFSPPRMMMSFVRPIMTT